MRRVVFNKKGGVGKTTIVSNLAAISARRGRRTLVVDLDPQANATMYLLGQDPEQLQRTVVDFFQQTLGFSLFSGSPNEFVHSSAVPNLDVLPSHPSLDVIQNKLESRYKIYKLRDALDKLSGYDDVFIDTPPALNFFTVSALIAADRCLIPFDCDDFSRRALYGLLAQVREVREDHNTALAIEGIVVNQFQPRAKLPTQLIGELEAEGLPVLRPFLNSSVKVRESHQQRLPLVACAPHHKLTEQYEALYQTLEDAGRPARAKKPAVVSVEASV